MSELVFASRMMREVIAPPGIAGSKSERVREAARRLRWKYSRALSVWYADERVSLKPHELREIEEASGVRYGKQEVSEIDELISRAGALLESQDADFHGAFIAAVRAFAGALARSRTER
ncbi:hypothetical protein C7441_112148 [Pseudaminobacter salicylatoxidans]|uniref:Uncharacterized protein n=2 Tax=Pseudaminobacter salicylatoxidans TaxID=93369 RepID=A0A316BZU6_PSESE|nr:hypothetical protein C7441_112148 [Pseudaminobacter salicylatoxidans]